MTPSPAGRVGPDPADRPVRGLVIAVTDRSQLPAGRSVLDVIGAVLDGGAHGVLVRERDLPIEERAALVAAAGQLCAAHGALLLVASPLPLIRGDRPISGPIDHIDSARWVLQLRRDEPVPADLHRPTTWVGRSCHDLAELRRACDERLDLVTLSPVAASASKPGHGPALGTAGVADLISTVRAEYVRTPAILALGGVDEVNAGSWVRAGADGVAVMGALMRAENPEAAMRAVLKSVSESVSESVRESATAATRFVQ